MLPSTKYKYSVWVSGTHRKKGKRPVMIGDDLEGLRDYAKRQRVAAEVRTTRTGVRVYPKENGHA